MYMRLIIGQPHLGQFKFTQVKMIALFSECALSRKNLVSFIKTKNRMVDERAVGRFMIGNIDFICRFFIALLSKTILSGHLR